MTKLNQIEQKFCEELTKAYGKTFDEVLKACDLDALSDDEKERLRIFFVFRTKYNSKKRESIFVIIFLVIIKIKINNMILIIFPPFEINIFE